MKTEKLKLNADYLLLGERGVSRTVMLFPRLLRGLAVALFVLGALNTELLYSGVPALGALYVFAAVSLRILIWCSTFLRDRWFMSRVNGAPAALSELLVRFTFSDLLRAFRLSVTASAYCLVRTTLFLALPLCALAVSIVYVQTGISSAVLAVIVCGNILFLLVAGFFCAAALCTVFYAAKLSCFEKSGIVRQFYHRLKALDKVSFSLLNFQLFFGGIFGIRKEMAGFIYSDSLIMSPKAWTEQLLINY